jgi:beta-glucanase (GH16 family)
MVKAYLTAQRTIVAAGMASFLICIFTVASPAQSLAGWKLVWSDEFNGDSVDNSKWGLELQEGDHGSTSYTSRPQNLFVANGCMALQAQKESYGGQPYTSSQVSTRNKASWCYCRIDVRAKLPAGKGMWPAIWLMPVQSAYGGWPSSGEIDIMENLGANTRLDYTTIHFGPNNQSLQKTCTAPATATLSDSFHVYTMIWDSLSFNFYLDSINYGTMNQWAPSNVAYPKPFDKSFFLILDLAIGGSWGGLPDTNTVFPQSMLVDWVHVYQRGVLSVLPRATRIPLESDLSMAISGRILNYALKSNARVTLALYDARGRRILSIIDGDRSQGKYSIDLAAYRLAKGVYICNLETSVGSAMRQIVVE